MSLWRNLTRLVICPVLGMITRVDGGQKSSPLEAWPNAGTSLYSRTGDAEIGHEGGAC